MMQISAQKAFFLGFLLRVVFLFWGLYQDNHLQVKFTDIDYVVFSDAAKAVVQADMYPSKGFAYVLNVLPFRLGDPFTRMTYRYTPFLALLLVPNNWFSLWGKIIFACGDLGIAYLALNILRKSCSVSESAAVKSVFFGWLINPIVAQISTRGSSDSLTGCLILLMLNLLLPGKHSRDPSLLMTVCAGLIFGVAVHWRLFPVIYAFSIVFYLGRCRGLFFFLSVRNILFAVAASITLTLATYAAYAVWGSSYLTNGILYHLHRLDHRHNFSPVYYPVYLGLASDRRTLSKPIMTLCQFVLLIASGYKLARRNLTLAFFIQSLIFVSFNSVITAQYFLWYQWFLPILLPQMLIPMKQGIACAILWILSNSLWLSTAFHLEMLGKPNHLIVWAAGLLFLAVNTFIAGKFVTWEMGSPSLSKVKTT